MSAHSIEAIDQTDKQKITHIFLGGIANQILSGEIDSKMNSRFTLTDTGLADKKKKVSLHWKVSWVREGVEDILAVKTSLQ